MIENFPPTHHTLIATTNILAKDLRPQPRDPCVLVVDDDPDARNILRFIMEQQGYLVKEAHDGQAALDIILESKPAVILMDLMMPGMDGFTLLNRIKARRDLRYIPVIVISAMSEADVGWLVGVEDLFEKGRYSIEVLQAKVKTLVAHLLP